MPMYSIHNLQNNETKTREKNNLERIFVSLMLIRPLLMMTQKYISDVIEPPKLKYILYIDLYVKSIIFSYLYIINN